MVDLGEMRFGLESDTAHASNGLNRELPHGRLAGKHDGVRSIVDCVGNVVGLGTRRPRVLLHGIEHFRRGDHRLAGVAGFRDQLLLDRWHALERNLHTEVAASHHDPVERGDDGVSPFNRFRPLDFREQRHVESVLECGRAQFIGGVGRTHEQQR